MTGITPFNMSEYPKPVIELRVVWTVHRHGAGPCFGAIGFGDGSGKHTVIRETARCGCGVVSAEFNDNDALVLHAEAHGPLPGPLQLVPLAEVMAFLMYLRHAVAVNGSYHFVTDCAYVQDSFYKGQSAMCGGWTAHCNVWQEVFRVARDIGIDNSCIHKVKSHQKTGSSSAALGNLWIAGNAMADSSAKVGAKMHPHSVIMYEAIEATADAAKTVAKYIAAIGLNIVQTHSRPELLTRAQATSDVASGLVSWNPDEHIQSKMEYGGRWRCKRCLASSATPLRGKCETSWESPRARGHGSWHIRIL